MQTKAWYQSKTIWAAIVTILITAWNAGVNSIFSLPVIPDFVYAILGFLGLYSRVTANSVIK